VPDDPRAALAGLRVLDASRVLAGPFCGQILGDLGAEVIKVERPGAGDETRAWGPPFLAMPGLPPTSAYYLSCNRNKRGIAIDLACAEGRELFEGLLRCCDVLLENFKADSARKLGLDPARLLTVNPRLIVCSISGFGRTGPLSDLPGYDFAVQALSGLMSVTGPVEGPPSKVGVAVADVLTGLYAAVSVLACLQARQHTGHGYAIDLALLDCAVAAQVNLAQAYLTSGQVPGRQGNAHLQIVPYQLFATADGWIVLAVGNDAQWRRFCAIAGKADWADDERFAVNRNRVENRMTLVPLVEALFRTRTTASWQELLVRADVPHAPLWTYADLFAHPQAAARGLRLTVTDAQGRPLDLVGPPFHIPGAPPAAATMPPALGQDTDAVLGDLLGLDAERLRDLRDRGVI
jgi:crotonobetainyl-CoA:carnitine CoA-transferase CaiB-like acyl-CoA transferase